MYIVAWSIRKTKGADPKLIDHWEAFDEESADLAVKRYKALLDDENVYTATLAGALMSTDYDICDDAAVDRIRELEY